MPYYQVWEEFARAAEKLYLTDPMKVNLTHYRCFLFSLEVAGLAG